MEILESSIAKAKKHIFLGLLNMVSKTILSKWLYFLILALQIMRRWELKRFLLYFLTDQTRKTILISFSKISADVWLDQSLDAKHTHFRVVSVLPLCLSRIMKRC